VVVSPNNSRCGMVAALLNITADNMTAVVFSVISALIRSHNESNGDVGMRITSTPSSYNRLSCRRME
jgi:hypothetical protein